MFKFKKKSIAERKASAMERHPASPKNTTKKVDKNGK
jgi:hypothetical protein